MSIENQEINYVERPTERQTETKSKWPRTLNLYNPCFSTWVRMRYHISILVTRYVFCIHLHNITNNKWLGHTVVTCQAINDPQWHNRRPVRPEADRSLRPNSRNFGGKKAGPAKTVRPMATDGPRVSAQNRPKYVICGQVEREACC